MHLIDFHKFNYEIYKREVNMKTITKSLVSLASALLVFSGALPLGINVVPSVAAATAGISNDSLSAKIGDLGQIEELNIKNNPANKKGNPINFVLPNNTSPQNDVQHQWMGEMIFSYRTGDSKQFPDDRTGFVEVDTNKTLAAGGSTKFTTINPTNQYFSKTASPDGKKVEVNFIGQNLESAAARVIKGFDVKSVFNTDTEDGSMLWEITVKNKSSKYIEFGDIGLPMPWNNKYLSTSDTYDNRVTVHNFAGADSGYSYAIRTSGEGNFMMFAPVPESGARIEYVDYWLGDTGELRNGTTYSNWVGDSGGWFPGLNVLYIHSKDIQKTGRGYFKDATSLVLAPDEQKTYKFKFSAVRAGDNSPQVNAQSPNNASTSMEDREANLRSTLYKSGMIDAVALPGFQAAINMPVMLDLHYDDRLIDVQSVDIQSVIENDPFDAAHIPVIKSGQTRSAMVNNSRAGRGLPDGNPGYTESVQFVETKIINGEQHHLYSLNFGNIGNNSVRVDYKLKADTEQVNKFTQFEFNILAELDKTSQAHSDFMVNKTQDKDPNSPTFGIYRDWYLTTGIDMTTSHWGDDWSHDNINFMTMKNYLDPSPTEIRSIENYLIDFMWQDYMKNTQNTFTVANYLKDSGVYTNVEKPYVRTFSEMMESTGYFNMYRIQKAYPNLLEYRETPQYYLEKAYGIYFNRVSSGATGFYGEQQIPDMIEALKEEGMMTEYANLKAKFAQTKGRNITNAAYPYGSEFEYDNTGEEGAYSAAKALRTYYPGDARAAAALKSMELDDLKTRAMRGIQPNWYYYSVPVFRAGEGWWNFQYTASLAGSIMDDWLRYEDNGKSEEQAAIAQQRNYAAKISNFNAVNMGQISAQSVGGIAWRYNAQKGGTGTKNVNDGGTRVMNNGWQDFSGESEEGLYGSLLRISSDIVTDPIFGLFGYGASVTDVGGTYHITPKDGFGKRISLMNEKIYLVSESDKIESAEIQKDGKAFKLQVSNLAKSEHATKITFDGAGVENGYYTIKLDDEDAGQFYVQNNRGTAVIQMSSALTAELTIEKKDTGVNQAPQVTAKLETQNPQAMIPFVMNGIVTDDGAPNGAMTYQWEVVRTPEGGNLIFKNPKSVATEANGTKGGSYTVRLTANDGQESVSNELTFELAAPPEKQPPVIGVVTGGQDASNSSILVLSGNATPDPVYSAVFEPVWTYGWTVKQKPDGAADVTFVNGDKANAYAHISKAGTYVFTFTAADEGKMSSKDVTINISKDTDGSYKAISAVTQINTVPILPQQMDILYNDGYRQSVIQWNEVNPASYAQAGEFVVEGNIVDSELKVRVTVYVVKAQPQNNALTARPSASFSGGDGYPEAMNNGNTPKSSSDFSASKGAANSAWHNWGREGEPAWVMYQWDEPFLASSMDVYVFKDGGGNFQPTDMKLQLRDVDGNWYTPRGVVGLGNALNKFNTTTFEPAYITGARLDMKPVTVGIGILEWMVNGFTGGVDKSQLVQVINFANSLKAANFIDQGLAPIAAAKAAASAVMSKKDATEEDVAQAIANLLRDLRLLSPKDKNMAFVASASASFTSSWESLPALNDGLKTATTNPHWGSWGNTSSEEWVQYDWPQGATIQSSNLMQWTDNGGILAPTKYTYQYIPKNSITNEWVTAGTVTTGIVALTTPVGSSNIFGFDPVLEVKSLRVTMTKKVRDGNGVGLWEWEVVQRVPVTGIIVTGAGNTTTVVNGGTLQMRAAVLPVGASNSAVTWLIQNGTGSATIDANGLLTATGVGTVTVTATASDGSGVTGTLQITIGAISIPLSTNTSIQMAVSHSNLISIDALNKALNVTDGTTSDQVITQVTSTDESVQSYSVTDANGAVKISSILVSEDKLVVTAEDGTTQAAYTIQVAQPTAADIASGITSLAAPAKDATSLTLPSVPDGYTVAVKSSDATSVIQTDGTIIPPSVETTVHLVLEVTRTSDNTKAFTGSVPVVVPAKTVAAVPTATLTVTSAVYSGQSFDLTYGLSGLGSSVNGGVYAEELTVNYDSTKLQLSAVTSVIDGIFVTQSGTPGQIRIVSASEGAAHAINASDSGAILKLSFLANPADQSASSTVSLSGVVVSDSHGVETQVQGATSSVQITVVDKTALTTLIATAQAKLNAAVEGSIPGQYPAGSKAALQAAITNAQIVVNNAVATPEQVTQAATDLNASIQAFLASINVALPGDVNGDGKSSIGDLAIVASHYGEIATDANWLASADINNDGVIDIIDLAAVAHNIITQ
jgi:hypothetical protein